MYQISPNEIITIKDKLLFNIYESLTEQNILLKKLLPKEEKPKIENKEVKEIKEPKVETKKTPVKRRGKK